MKLWIELDQLTHYMLVPGGVIVRYEAYSDDGNGCALTSSMVFVPCGQREFEKIYPERKAE